MLVTSPARASAPELAVSPGVTSCPSSADLRREIVANAGRDDFDAADAPHVVVHVHRDAQGRLLADISVATGGAPPARRTIEAPHDSCEDVVRAAALAVSLAIEREPSADKPAPPEPPAPPPSTEPVDRGVEVPKAKPRETFVAMVTGMSSLGLLPQPTAGVGAQARIRMTERTWLSARGMWFPEARMPNDAFGMRFFGGGAGVCVDPTKLGAAAIDLCAHLLGGLLDVTTASVAMAGDDAKGFFGASLSAGARVRVAGPVTAGGGVEGILPFAHPTWLTAPCPQSGFSQPLAALALSLGVGLSIP